jgi:hypothetical protein
MNVPNVMSIIPSLNNGELVSSDAVNLRLPLPLKLQCSWNHIARRREGEANYAAVQPPPRFV